MNCKPTPDELSLEQAMSEGMAAGMRGRQASENPYQSGTPEHKEWEHCRAMAAHCALAGMTVAA